MTPTTAASPRLRDRWRTWAWILVAAVIVAVTAFIVTKPPHPKGYLDPEATNARGGHALAQLLRDRGVTVTRATTIDQVQQAAAPDVQLMIVDNRRLTDDDINALKDVPGDLLLLAPAAKLRYRLAPEVTAKSWASDDLAAPGCTVREATRAGVIHRNFSTTFGFGSLPEDWVSCYDGALVRYREGERTVTVLGDDAIMWNSEIDQQGNAALAMNLAGRRPHLLWYVPERSAAGGAPAPRSIEDLIPDQVVMSIWQLCIVVLLLAIWRGRRLGPVVTERLPVIVRASETTEGRSRLYRSRRARDRATAALREAAIYRVVRRIGLPVDSEPQVIVASVAQRTGRDPQEAAQLLFGEVPSSDQQLTTLVHQLDILERQVRDS